ncbi:HAD hydrolase family protein [Lachnospiraceae bacterium 46-61]
MIVFASDLDNTLIFSYKKKNQCQQKMICVEKKEGKELSYMTQKAYNTLQKLYQKIIFVPITTRSIEQYQRIQFFDKIEYVLTTNGGILLKNNNIDKIWLEETKKLILPSEKELQKAIYLLKKDNNICFEIRIVDDIFVYTKSLQPQKTANNIIQKLDLNQIFVDTNGEKIYVFPKILNKGFALKRLKNLLHCKKIFSAGDSRFDISMLQQSDVAFWSGEQSIVMKNGVCYHWQQNVVEFGEKVVLEIEKYINGI